MSSSLKNKKVYFLRALILFTYFTVSSCSSNMILTDNLDLTLPENKDGIGKFERSSNNLYISNLANYKPPGESELLEEAGFKNLKVYNNNANILASWIKKELSQKERLQLSRNCETLVGSQRKDYPLSEQSLACVGWWFDRKNNENQQLLQRSASFSQGRVRKFNKRQKKEWFNFRGVGFNRAFNQIDPKNLKQALNLTREAERFAADCEYIGATSALILRLEVFLPNQSAFSNIEKLYNKSEKCLLPNMDPSEKIHLRVGLLRLILGFPSLALHSLEKNLLEEDPQESSRTLFWLGVIYQKMNKNSQPKYNEYWKKLIREVPLSLAAIVVSEQMGNDPLDNLVSDNEIILQSREAAGWNDHNLEAFVFDLMRARKEKVAASEWGAYVARTSSVSNNRMVLYWALGQNAVSNYKNSIFMLGKYTRNEKNYQASRSILHLQYPKPYLREISEMSNDIDPILVLSLIRQESAFDPYARSSANARGLMQILPSTARTLKKKMNPSLLYDPETNLNLGISYLTKLLKRYDGRVEYVLAAYNAGAANLDKWRERVPNDNIMLFCDYIPFRETRSYVSIILRNYYWYGRILSEKDDSLAKRVQLQSKNSKWKSDSVLALLESAWKANSDSSYKSILDKIYIFGNKTSQLSAESSQIWSRKKDAVNKTTNNPFSQNYETDRTALRLPTQ